MHALHADTARKVEEQLIAGILLRPKDFFAASDAVTPDDFIDQVLSEYWRAFGDMAKSGVEFWRQSVLVSELAKRGLIAKIGGDKAFAELLLKVAPGHTVYHSEEVAKWAERRRVAVAIQSLAQEINTLAFDPSDVIAMAQSKLVKAQSVAGEDVKQLGEVMADYLLELDDIRTNKKPLTLIQTGFGVLDQELAGGVAVGEYAILAARPSIGKSALAMDIAWNAATTGSPSLFVSLEMSNQQISQRQFAKQSDVSMYRMRTATMSDSDSLSMVRACEKTKEIPLYVWQASGATIGRIESRIRAEIAKKNIKLVIIDYLGLIKGQDSRQSIYERVTQISGELARMAKQLNVALLVLCQLGRAAEGEVPTINQLRDSGAIEQDADIILLLHREKRDSKEAKLLLEKQRNGTISQLELQFDGKRFADSFIEAQKFHGDFQKGF